MRMTSSSSVELGDSGASVDPVSAARAALVGYNLSSSSDDQGTFGRTRAVGRMGNCVWINKFGRELPQYSRPPPPPPCK